MKVVLLKYFYLFERLSLSSSLLNQTFITTIKFKLLVKVQRNCLNINIFPYMYVFIKLKTIKGTTV